MLFSFSFFRQSSFLALAELKIGISLAFKLQLSLYKLQEKAAKQITVIVMTFV